MIGMWQDVRYAVRLLWRRPGLAAAVIATMALAIGATTAIYSVVQAVLLQPLPFANPDQIVTVGTSEQDESASTTGFLTYLDWRDRSRSFRALAVMRNWMPTLVWNGEPERLLAVNVSPNYFGMLGVSPALGRDFRPSEGTPHGWRVVILSHGLWQRRFQGDPSAVGRSITLNGRVFRVVGVMGSDYQPLVEQRLYHQPDLWAPLGYDAASDSACRRCEHLKVVGRLRRGISPDAARSEMQAVQDGLLRQFPGEYGQDRLVITPLADALSEPARPTLLVLFAAAGLVLLVACANVSGLLIVHATARAHEIAVRAALGASRGRLARQLLTESLVLSLLAGLIGVALAQIGRQVLVALAPADIPRLDTAGIDVGVLAFAAAVTVLSALAAGLVPARRVLAVEIDSILRSSDRRTAGHGQPARRVLVAAQLALAIVLLSSAGLMVRTIHALSRVDPGFDPRNLLTFQTSFVGPAYAEDPAVEAYTNAMIDRLRAVPGVLGVATASQVPLGGNMDRWAFRIEGRSTDPDDVPSADRYGVTPDYLKVMGIELRAGRFFDSRDTRQSEPVVVVGETTARRLWGERSPIGERVRLGGPRGPLRRIIGIAEDVRHFNLTDAPTMTVYTPNAQVTESFLVFVVRTAADRDAILPRLRDAIWSVAGDVPIYNPQTGEEMVRTGVAARRFASALLLLFAALAMTLTAVGLYGVVAFDVSARTRELGLRLALGAARKDVVRLVAKGALSVVGAGLVSGVIAAMFAARGMSALLWGVAPTDTVTHCAVAILLLIVAVVAHIAPVRRALATDPAIALREE
jgi:predicted permease